MSYVILMPSRSEAEYLHRSRCKFYNRRTRRTDVLSRAQLEPNDGFIQELHLCAECLPDGIPADLRATLWLLRIKADHNRLVEARAEYERWQRIEAAKADFFAQFEILRMSCEIVWGHPVWLSASSSHHADGNISLVLGHPTWGHGDVGHIYLKVTDGTNGVFVDGMNFSTGLISSARDAHALSHVFGVIEAWRSKEFLSVPAGAPNFYGIR